MKVHVRYVCACGEVQAAQEEFEILRNAEGEPVSFKTQADAERRCTTCGRWLHHIELWSADGEQLLGRVTLQEVTSG